MVITGGTGTAAVTDRVAWTEEAQGAMTDFKLVLNGQDRFKEQGGKYFNQVQPYHHHTGSPFPGVYAYSFALSPKSTSLPAPATSPHRQRAGVHHHGRRPNATNLHMFATNYNVLRIQSGMGGLAFSN